MEVMEKHPLDEEMRTFADAKATLQLGTFVVIKSQEILSGYPTFLDAYGAGLKHWGYVPMLVKKVELEEVPELFPTVLPNNASIHYSDHK
jgi:hypothetical protein